jgi:tRNA threonylcarbamoyladenosine biosynthesis protein TsaB
VALSLGDTAPLFRHELVSAGASQLLLPWIEELLLEADEKLSDLDAIAVGIGPGAFTGVRLSVAAVQGLATAAGLPVLPVVSLDAIAAQVVSSATFIKSNQTHFAVAIDARMDEIYWAQYEISPSAVRALRLGEIHLSKPEDIDLVGIHYLAGSAIQVYGDRLFTLHKLASNMLDADITISALGVLDYAKYMFDRKQQIEVAKLEPLYIRNKVALTSNEREIAFNKDR